MRSYIWGVQTNLGFINVWGSKVWGLSEGPACADVGARTPISASGNILGPHLWIVIYLYVCRMFEMILIIGVKFIKLD